LLIEDIKKVNSNGIIIAPALFVDDELYSYGDFDEEKFIEMIPFSETRNYVKNILRNYFYYKYYYNPDEWDNIKI
ncbi:MAG: hypothetical protein KAS97_06925, partial [Candidatus Aminicenantes bacterium]|nr:hypothetical protein [Candidatus Aminicenantes bacterium]